MLERVEHVGGVVTYQSPLLRDVGVVHAFSTRVGGVSKPPYESLNLGLLAKDAQTDGNANVSENFRRLRRAIGAERLMRVEVRQVHGAEVWSPPAKPIRAPDAPCADAMVTDRVGKLLTIRTADCVPVLLASKTGHVVAAIHAGWRGVVEKVVPAAVHVLYQSYGVSPQDLVAAIGPCISVEHFEVGSEVGVLFAEAELEQAVERTGAKPHVDLRAAVLQQLVREGLRNEAVDRTDRCTYRDREEFYSHRRDVTHEGQRDTGRMAAVIAVGG